MPSTSSVARTHPSLQAPYWDAELRGGTFTFSCLLNLAVPSGEPEARRTCILSSVIAVQRRKSLFSIAIVANCVKLMLLIFPLRRLRDSSGEHRADDVCEGKSTSPPVRPGVPVLALSIPGNGNETTTKASFRGRPPLYPPFPTTSKGAELVFLLLFLIASSGQSPHARDLPATNSSCSKSCSAAPSSQA